MGYKKQSCSLYERNSSPAYVRIFQLCGLTPQKIRYVEFNEGLTEYKAINVLENPVIREEVKVYSSWPTYPQLYIDGSLVGGSNILQEMHKDQSLERLLSEKNLI